MDQQRQRIQLLTSFDESGWYGFIIVSQSFLPFSALTVLTVASSYARVTACDSHQLSVAGWLQVAPLPADAPKMMPLLQIHR